ncbi:MAG: cupin domain-containing protein [Oscillospiraceae bacterium]|nr:cupin domain-containing protein [Oscillospiraceae bacterium]
MQIVLLSGGSGKRLWPLSNEIRSKQFLKVVKDEDGEVESMVQRVYRQISAATDAKITIATGASQVESIKNQLGDKVSIVVEPERRNTFPAIALASAYLRLEKNCALDETIIVLPVDPYVDSEYFCMLKTLDKAVQNNAADIVLMGVKPTYPSEKYGYIIPAETDKEINRVAEFKEKPNVKTAQEFIDRGGLWNCGVFAFKLSYLMKIVDSVIKYDSFNDVLSKYNSFEKISFDYAVVEKADSVAAVSYDGEWKDLGTWNTLTEVMDNKPIGDVIISEDCVNTHAINELEIPVIVMGASNMVVAASPDGILVADKEQSSYIKKYVEDRDMRPMFEERSWGEYKVLDFAVNDDGTKSLTKRKKIKQGMKIDYQSHKSRSEVITVISGKCIITINDRAHEAYAGDTYAIAEGVKHGLEAVTDTEIIEIQVGKELIGDGTEIAENAHIDV